MGNYLSQTNNVIRGVTNIIPEVRNTHNIINGLEYAIKQNNEAAVRSRLKGFGDSIDKELEQGNTYLHIAAEHNAVTCIPILVQEGASINRCNSSGDTPLHVAILNNNPGALSKLIKLGANVNQMNGSQKVPLFIAAIKGHYECIMELLKNDDCKKHIDRKHQSSGCTALIAAASIGDLKSMHALIDAGANVNAQSDISGYSALHFVIPYYFNQEHDQNNWSNTIENGLKCISALIHSGANVNLQDKSGNTPLHGAIFIIETNGLYYSDPRLERLSCSYINALVNAGADIHIKNSFGDSPLGLLSKRYCQAFFNRFNYKFKKISRTRLLLLKSEKECSDKKYNMEEWKEILEKEHETREALFMNSDFQGLEEFHKNRMSIRVKEHALITAASNNDIELVKLLLKYGVYINASDYFHIDRTDPTNYGDTGYTALDLATTRGHIEMISILQNKVKN